MQKRLLFILVIFVVTLSIQSCQQQEDSKRTISVTILPQKFFAEQIAGDRFHINCVVPANANPEAYDPSPRQLAAVENSEAYLRVGMIGFEMAWMDKLSQNNPDMKIYDLSQGIDMIQSEHSHTHHDGESHTMSVLDPHIWCSPKNARVMARNIYNALVELDSMSRQYYTRRYESLVQRIDSVDRVIMQILLPCEGTTFAIYHPSLSYFARDYNLQQLCIESMGKETSAFAMRSVVDQAHEKGVKVVFVQQEFNPRQVYTFAQEIEAQPIEINPLNYDWINEMLSISYAIAHSQQ